MTRLMFIACVVVLNVLACSRKSGPDPTPESPEPVVQPASEPTAANAVPPGPESTDSPAGSQPRNPPLSESERALQVMAALPESPLGAMDLSSACQATQEARDKQVLETELPKARLRVLDGEAIGEWQVEVIKSLRASEQEALGRLEADMRAKFLECLARLEEEEGHPSKPCQAWVLGDASRCDPSEDGYQECRSMSVLMEVLGLIKAWDRENPPVAQCDKPPLSMLFFSSEMCQAALQKGCGEMLQMIQANLCSVVRLHKAPIPCDGDGAGSPWCVLLKAISSPNREECEKAVHNSVYPFPSYVCKSSFDPVRQQSASCSESDLATLYPPMSSAIACGALTFALSGVSPVCNPSDDELKLGQCIGPYLMKLGEERDARYCVLLGGVARKWCDAWMQGNPDLCPVERASGNSLERTMKCLAPHMVIKEDHSDPQRGIVVLDVLGPFGWQGDCVFVATVPSPDGDVWNVPVQAKVVGAAFTTIRLPSTITKVEGLKVSYKCKWESASPGNGPAEHPGGGTQTPTPPGPPATEEAAAP